MDVLSWYQGGRGSGRVQEKGGGGGGGGGESGGEKEKKSSFPGIQDQMNLSNVIPSYLDIAPYFVGKPHVDEDLIQMKSPYAQRPYTD